MDCPFNVLNDHLHFITTAIGKMTHALHEFVCPSISLSSIYLFIFLLGKLDGPCGDLNKNGPVGSNF